MPARNRRGRFVKGGRSKGIVRYRTRTKMVTRYRSKGAKRSHRRRRSSGGGGGVNLLHAGAVALGMNYLLSSSNGNASAIAMANKIPGAKTFGAPAAVGLACLGIDRFVKRNKWLKLAGVAGVILAAAKVGEQGKSFQWVGDDEVEDLEIGDDDDDYEA